ncbi:lecithin retinol acyltransferase domain-containing protein [Ditylenchus destructor]|nr:lecithin retinol acyltransferase domain-containing protein [Ditylenchus destructor]
MFLNYFQFLTNFVIILASLSIVEGITDEKPKDSIQEVPEEFIESFSDTAKQKKITTQEEKVMKAPIVFVGAIAPRVESDCPIDIAKRTTRAKKMFGLTLEAEAQKRKVVGEWFNMEEHWAIYLGDGKIISLRHIRDRAGRSLIAQICENELANSRYKDNWMRKNNYMDLFFTRFDRAVILERARGKVGCKYDYKILYWNCEYFVNFIVYDKVFSIQVAHYSKHRLPAKAVEELVEWGLLK